MKLTLKQMCELADKANVQVEYDTTCGLLRIDGRSHTAESVFNYVVTKLIGGDTPDKVVTKALGIEVPNA